MLTDQQLTETALDLINRQLDALATYDQSEEIGEILCRKFCTTPDCGHDSAESAEEMRAVHQHIKQAVAALRTELAWYGSERGVSAPAARA